MLVRCSCIEIILISGFNSASCVVNFHVLLLVLPITQVGLTAGIMPIHRTIKNVVKNYSYAEVKVREATSNDPWGPSNMIMAEIAQLSHDLIAFSEIMQMVWKRLNDHGKNWRHVYKSLVLLDYLVKSGSDHVVQYCSEHIIAIQTLKDFQHVEDGVDHGMNVREKAKQLVAILKDSDKLKNERSRAASIRNRFGLSTGYEVSAQFIICLLLVVSAFISFITLYNICF